MKKLYLVSFIILQLIGTPLAIAYFIYNKLYSYNGIWDITLTIIIVTIGVRFIWFCFKELYYWAYGKNQLVNFFYDKLLCKQDFPNPWNYYFNDGITYLKDIANDKNVNAEIRVQAMRLYAEINRMKDRGDIVGSNRFSYALAIAIRNYFRHFKDEHQKKPELSKVFNDERSDKIYYIFF